MSDTQRKLKHLGFFGAVLILPLLLLAGLLSIVYLPIAVLFLRIRFERMKRRMVAQNRFLKWGDVAPRLASGEGTLIIEQANKIGVRFWWTPDDLLSAGPPPIRDFEGLGYAYITGKTSDPFVPWCMSYVSVNEGKAFLAIPENIKFPPGPLESGFLLGLYPKAVIVHTLRLPANE